MARTGAARPVRTSRRKSGSAIRGRGASISEVAGEPQPAKLPALVRVEEIAVARPHMAARGRAAAAAQHLLIDHELAVILADNAFLRREAGIRLVGASGPFPDVAEHLLQGR